MQSHLTIFKAGKFLFHSKTAVLLTLKPEVQQAFLLLTTSSPADAPSLSDLRCSVSLSLREDRHKSIHFHNLPPSVMACDLYFLIFTMLACVTCEASHVAEVMCTEVSDSRRSLARYRSRLCRGSVSGEYLPSDVQLFSVPKGFLSGGSEGLYWRNKARVLRCAQGHHSLSLLLLTPLCPCTLMRSTVAAGDFGSLSNRHRAPPPREMEGQ